MVEQFISSRLVHCCLTLIKLVEGFALRNTFWKVEQSLSLGEMVYFSVKTICYLHNSFFNFSSVLENFKLYLVSCSDKKSANRTCTASSTDSLA